MTSPSTPRRNPDSAYRRLFAHRDLMADMIRLYVNPHLEDRLDPATLKRCNGTYVTADLRERRSDLVWLIRAKDERWFYIYLLLEFQSRVDRFMAVRLLGYIALLWQDLIAQKQIMPDGHLPPVLPLVLHSGSSPWTAPRTMTELITTPLPALAPMQPAFSYLLLDENRLPTDAGVAAGNVVAAVFALQQCLTLDAQERLNHRLDEWLQERPDIRRDIATWYAETLAPSRLPALASGHTTTIAEVQAMSMTQVRYNLNRQIKRQIVRKMAEGKLDMILSLVGKGSLNIELARAEVMAMLKEKAIPAALARSTLDQLG
jgi:hypothetical protein